MIRTVLRTAIAIFLIAPFLILFWKVKTWSLPETRELFRAIEFTIKQSFLSALLALVIGIAGARGLIYWQKRRRWIEFFLLAPNVLPTLFIILACFKVFSPFPFGLAGIVIIHVAMNVGLVSVTIAHLFENKVGGWSELALVEGASKRSFLWVTLNYLKRDLSLIFLFVFSICFTSLTVPLVAGRFDALTTETLIYEKIKVSGEWGQALGLSMLQSTFILILTIFLSRGDSLTTHSVTRNMDRLTNRWGLMLPLTFSILILASQFEGLNTGLAQTSANSAFAAAISGALQGTLMVGAGVGLLTFFLLSIAAYCTPHKNFQRFLNGYVAPSSVLTGFSLLLLDLQVSPLIKMVFGITLIQLPLFFRLYLNGRLEQLESQILVGRTLSASWRQIFWCVLSPQIFVTIGLASGLSAFWACGEFALSSLLTGQDLTLALLMKSSIAAYRLEAATLLVWLTLACGGMVLLAFWSLGYGLSRKSNS
jgi:thiamine transport system permease protein